MATGPQPPRGTQDLLPPFTVRYGDHVRRSADLFEAAGYGRIITPMFEDTDVFERGVGEGSDIVRKEMYTFTDRSGNELTLRPEGTAPVVRAVISNHLWDAGLPVKLWYEAAMFRYDRPQRGRYRQHHQLGIEAVGSEDPAIDAEVILLGRQMLDEAGVTDTSLLLNSSGHPGCRAAYLPELMAFLEANRGRLDEDCNRRMETNPLRVFDCKNADDQAVLADAPSIEQALCGDCRAHFDAVQALLKDADIAFTIAPRLVRGLDYYTRTTFEFQTDLLEAAQSTVCGGGRYDGLSELLGGPSLPGIGFGAGMERVLIAQEAAARAPHILTTPTPSRGIDSYVVPIDEGSRSSAFRLAAAIRARGIGAALGTADRGLKGHMKHADRLGARAVVLIGQKERAAGVATVRDMATGEQTEVSMDDVPGWLEEHR